MPIFNVRVAVVALIGAETNERAIRELRTQLSAAGFEPLENDADAFLSED
ncbi:hypothetical protein ACWZHB_01310 [Nocardia sp. FBN12]